jgi:signal transduction histidine kinase
VHQHCAAAASPRGVAVTLDADRVSVWGDRGQLRRALLNLAQNAVQACPSGSGTVELKCAREPGGAAVVTVRDNGAGIDPQSLGKIWAPFFTTKEKGTGLGLAFVRDIARDHGASIDVSSTPGEGTTFTLVLKETG